MPNQSPGNGPGSDWKFQRAISSEPNETHWKYV